MFHKSEKSLPFYFFTSLFCFGLKIRFFYVVVFEIYFYVFICFPLPSPPLRFVALFVDLFYFCLFSMSSLIIVLQYFLSFCSNCHSSFSS